MLRPSTYHPIGSLVNNFRTAGLQDGPQFQGFEVPGTVGWGHIAARRYFALGPQPTDTWRKSAPRLFLIFHFSTFVIVCAECRNMPMVTIAKMPKIDTLDALEEHEEHEDDYQTNSN